MLSLIHIRKTNKSYSFSIESRNYACYNARQDGAVFLPRKEGGGVVSDFEMLMIILLFVQIILGFISIIVMILLCFWNKKQK